MRTGARKPNIARRTREAVGSLRLRMTLSGVAALALGIGLIAFLLVGRAERDMLAVEREREIGEAVRTATVLSHRVIEVQRTLQALAMQAEGGSLDDPVTLERFVQSTPLLKDIFALLFMAAKDGRVRVYVDDKGVQHPGIDISDRSYFRNTLKDGKPQISDVIYSRLDGAPGVVFTQPIRNETGVYGMLAGSVRLNSRGLLDSVMTTQSGYTSSVTVVVTNANGTILAHPDKNRVAQSLATEPYLNGAFQAWLDSGAPIEPQGLLLAQAGEVVSIAGVPGPDWLVWRVRDEAQLLTPLRDARRHALIIAGALIVVLSIAMFAWLGWLLAPLKMPRLLPLPPSQSTASARRLRAFALVALLPTISAGCASSAPTKEPIVRQLPPPPSFAQPVKVRAPKTGEPMLLIASRERAGRVQANRRLVEFRAWYIREVLQPLANMKAAP
jgi:hypothetical protein